MGSSRHVPPCEAGKKRYHSWVKSSNNHNDCDGGTKDTAAVGTLFSREEANQAARTDLLNDWNMDSFVSYEVEEGDGLVGVTAVYLEGEEMMVTVEEAKGLIKNLMRSQFGDF